MTYILITEDNICQTARTISGPEQACNKTLEVAIDIT